MGLSQRAGWQDGSLSVWPGVKPRSIFNPRSVMWYSKDTLRAHRQASRPSIYDFWSNLSPPKRGHLLGKTGP